MNDDSNAIVLILSSIILICWLAFLGLTVFKKDGELIIKIGDMELTLNSKADDNDINKEIELKEDKEDELNISRLRGNSQNIIAAAEKLYTEISMSTTNSSTFIKNSNSSSYAGMCVNLYGLTSNGYFKKNTSYTSDALVLIEVPYDGGITKITNWYYEDNYGINGLEKTEVNKLTTFNIKYNTEVTTALYNGDSENIDAKTPNGGPVGIISELTGIKKIIDESKTPTLTIKSNKAHGGTGETYTNIRCVKSKIY